MAFTKTGDNEKIMKIIKSEELENFPSESWKESEEKLDSDGNKIPSSVDSKNSN